MAETAIIVLFVALFVILAWAGMKMRGMLSVAALAVFLPACATAGGPYGGPINPITGAAISTSDILCGAIGVGGGLGTAKATNNAGWGVLVGATGALICKAISGAWETRDYRVIHQPVEPPVYHQPAPVLIPSGVHVPDGYKMEKIDVQNATRGVIHVRTPQGMVRIEPGGMVSFYEALSTGAGGAFYAVHATAIVQVPGGYQSRWANEFGHSNGTLARTVVFTDSRWDNKIVPAYGATRHEVVPPVEVRGVPGLKAEPVPPPPK